MVAHLYVCFYSICLGLASGVMISRYVVSVSVCLVYQVRTTHKNKRSINHRHVYTRDICLLLQESSQRCLLLYYLVVRRLECNLQGYAHPNRMC